MPSTLICFTFTDDHGSWFGATSASIGGRTPATRHVPEVARTSDCMADIRGHTARTPRGRGPTSLGLDHRLMRTLDLNMIRDPSTPWFRARWTICGTLRAFLRQRLVSRRQALVIRPETSSRRMRRGETLDHLHKEGRKYAQGLRGVAEDGISADDRSGHAVQARDIRRFSEEAPVSMPPTCEDGRRPWVDLVRGNGVREATGSATRTNFGEKRRWYHRTKSPSQLNEPSSSRSADLTTTSPYRRIAATIFSGRACES